MTIDFRAQINTTVASITDQITDLVGRADDLRGLQEVMVAHASKVGSPLIEPVAYPDVNWRVWIPPFREDHFDGDAIAAPFGDTYWPTLEDASSFLSAVLEDIEAGKHGALAPQS